MLVIQAPSSLNNMIHLEIIMLSLPVIPTTVKLKKSIKRVQTHFLANNHMLQRNETRNPLDA